MSELTKLYDSTEQFSSSVAQKCGECNKEVDEELKETQQKKGRKRIKKMLCKNCFNEFMGRSSQITFTMPNSLIMWLDEFVKSEKAKGHDLTQSNAVRRGLELLKKSLK